MTLRFSLFLYLSFIIFSCSNELIAQTVSDTFDSADIPTSLVSYSPACNGPLTTISITLPAGGPWTVTGIDISYDMTAQNGGFKSHQRSYIRCQNTTSSETTIYQGTGNTGGIQSYNRTGVAIANGPYPANAILKFEMRAWRTAAGFGCITTTNKVNNFSWIITVHYTQILDEGSVGIGTASPSTSAILDLSSSTQAFLPPRLTTAQRDAIAAPVTGMMIFNTTSQRLEIYTTSWSSIFIQSTGIKKLYGGTNTESVANIQKTSDGGYIAVGYSNSSNTGTLSGLTNNGGYDTWMVKLDQAGGILWQKLYGGLNDDYINYVHQTEDGGYIALGYTNSSNTGTLTGLTNNGQTDYWILKLDQNGFIVWQKLYGGSALDKGYGIEETVDGGFIAAGSSGSSNTGTLTGITSNGQVDYWIFKLDSSGNIVWQKLLGGSTDDHASGIHQTANGGYFAVGYSNSSSTGSLGALLSNGLNDYWLLKLDSLGNIEWQKLLGGTQHEYAHSSTLSSDGGFVVVGYTSSSNSGNLIGMTNNGANDMWIIKLDETGNIIWQRLLGGSADETGFYIVQTNDGGYAAAGHSSSSNTGTLLGLISNGNSEFYIARLDNDGAVVWQKLFGGSQFEVSNAIQQTGDGGFISGGYSSSANSGTLLGINNNGANDFFILKVDANGNPY